MPLIEFKTDLTNLPWGNDRREGGSSNQPYIQKDIPQGLDDDNMPINTPDFILRNGLWGPATALEDVSRMTQMLFDTKSPQGLLFTAKQNLLSRTSVKTEASKGLGYGMGAINQGIYNPLNTIAQAGVVAGGGHLNFLGIDGTAKTGIEERPGLIQSLLNKIGIEDNPLGINTYSSTLKNQSKDDNRLVLLQSSIFPESSTDTGNTQLQERLLNLNLPELPPILTKLLPAGIKSKNLPGTPGYRLNEGNNVVSYKGGPGAVLGIGKTNIRFADQRTGANHKLAGKEINTYLTERPIPELNFNKYLGVSTTGSGLYGNITLDNNGINDLGQKVYDNSTNTPYTYTQAQINQKAKEVKDNPNLYPTDFRDILDINPQSEKVLSISPSYRDKNIHIRVNSGDPGKTSGQPDGVKNVSNYGLPADQLMALDKITAMPMYTASSPNLDYAINDLCKFRIAAIDNDGKIPGNAVYMHFRAFLDNFDDSYNANWNAVNYVGRGDTLYNYQGFDRSISLGFTAAAQSKAELIPMYKKLNYLASTLTPDYTQAGFMRGNLLRLTVGGYLYEQPGFITSLNYTVPQETPWEIAINELGESDDSVKELPHIIKCTISFTPIHTFLPQKPNNPNNPDSRYIALANGIDSKFSNYKDEYRYYNKLTSTNE